MNILNVKKISVIIFISMIVFLLSYSKETFSAKKSSGPATVQYEAKDGFNIVGQVNIPKGASARSKVPLVIFAHSLGRSKLDWQGFPIALSSIGVATLSIDLRGHGQSILDKKGRKRYWQNFQNIQFKKYPDDLLFGITYIKDSYPEIDTNRIAIIGSGIGANAAVIAAGKSNKNIKTLVLLSPTLTYKGLDIRIPVVGYGANPVLIVAGKNNIYSYKDSQELIKYAQGVKVLEAYPLGSDGMDLLKFQPAGKTAIINWLKKYLVAAK